VTPWLKHGRLEKVRCPWPLMALEDVSTRWAPFYSRKAIRHRPGIEPISGAAPSGASMAGYPGSSFNVRARKATFRPALSGVSMDETTAERSITRADPRRGKRSTTRQESVADGVKSTIRRARCSRVLRPGESGSLHMRCDTSIPVRMNRCSTRKRPGTRPRPGMESHLKCASEANSPPGNDAGRRPSSGLDRFAGGWKSAKKEDLPRSPGLPWWESLIQDFRYAVRWLRKNPGAHD